MRAEKVIIDNTSENEDNEWNPDVEKLPAIVRKYLDHWLSPEQAVRRRYVTYKALRDMIRDGEAQERTVIHQYPNKATGGIIEKPFTFFKLKCNNQITNP